MRKKTLLLLIYIMGISLSSFGLNINSLINQALKNDLQLKQLKLSLNNALLEKKRSELKQKTSITIGNTTSPSFSLSHSFPNNSSTISMTPFISLKLGDPYYTNVSIASQLTSTLTPEGPKFSVAPSFSISQPLNELLGITESTALVDKQNLYYIEKAKIAIQNRIAEIKEQILSQTKTIVQTEEELEKNKYLMETKKSQLLKMQKLGNYSKGSYQYLSLENDIENLKRTITYLQTKLEMLKKELGYITGMKINKLPEPLTEDQLPKDYMYPIRKVNLEKNPDYTLANIEREIASLKLKNQTEETLPEYSVGLSYSQSRETSPTQGQLGTNLLRESFSFKLNDTFLQAGISQDVSTGNIGGEIIFSWTYNFDTTEDKIDTEELTNNLEITKLNLSDVIRRVKQSVIDINISLSQLINERTTIKSNIVIAKKQLEQIKTQFKQGLTSVDQINEALWNIKELEFEKRLNLLDIYLLGIKREKLFISSL